MRWSEEEYRQQVACLMGWLVAYNIILLLMLVSWLTDDRWLNLTTQLVCVPLLIIGVFDIYRFLQMVNENPQARGRKKKSEGGQND